MAEDMIEEIQRRKELESIRTILRGILCNLKKTGKPFTSNPNAKQGKVLRALIKLEYIKREKTGRNVTYKWMNGPVPEEEVCDIDEEVSSKIHLMRDKSCKMGDDENMEPDISPFSPEDLVKELRKRGWDVKCSKVVEL
jgi:hypothetical protein